jgi:hypothetical protein
MVPGRTGKQCRERWIGQLCPNITKGNWGPDEDAILIRNHAVHGNKWTAIAQNLPGRSAISVKNRWNWLLRHNLQSEGSHSRREEPIENEERERKKGKSDVLESLILDDGLFGSAFQEFQAKMLTG